ncbi:MAG: RluA family pseudouridine synthase [bacterium]
MNKNITLKRFINPKKGMRIDTFLHSKLRDTSRSFIQYLIGSENIRVNGKGVKKNYILKGDEEITVNLIADPATYIEAEEVPFDVLYEDPEFLIILKPSGIITHPVGRQRRKTLLQGLLFKYPELKHWPGLGKPGLVHRLDRETSGIMIVARNAAAQKNIMKQFEKRTVSKTYLAVVSGTVKNSGTVEAPIKRNEIRRTNFSVSPGGRYAKTHFRAVKNFKNYSLLLIRPYTGRTHQIRVHLSHIGFPVAGDKKYGGDDAPRIMLHAYSISFSHPASGKRVYFKTKFPKDFK